MLVVNDFLSGPLQPLAAFHHRLGQGDDFVDVQAPAGTAAEKAGDFDIAVAVVADVVDDGGDFAALECMAKDLFAHEAE